MNTLSFGKITISGITPGKTDELKQQLDESAKKNFTKGGSVEIFGDTIEIKSNNVVKKDPDAIRDINPEEFNVVLDIIMKTAPGSLPPFKHYEPSSD